MILWYTILSMCMIIIVRVGHFGPYLKNFKLRYSGPLKKSKNGLNKKNLKNILRFHNYEVAWFSVP